MSEPTTKRVEGPTPAGGAYSIGSYFHNDTAVAPRFANRLTIVEYDANGQVLNTTFGTSTPEEVMPEDPMPEDAMPDTFLARARRRARGLLGGTVGKSV